jgi:hypothetical protein
MTKTAIFLFVYSFLIVGKGICQSTPPPSAHPKLDALFHHNEAGNTNQQSSSTSTTTEPLAPASPYSTTTEPSASSSAYTTIERDSNVNSASNSTETQSTIPNTPTAQSIGENQQNPDLSNSKQVQNSVPSVPVQQQQASSQIQNIPTSQSMYRDTRLGSSSPLYNTYQKNDYGAGAITTNPNK